MGTSENQDPGAANDAARNAGNEVGTDPADTIAVACDLLRIGVFFDGTKNSRDHTAAVEAWHTNVDLLEHLYLETQGGPEWITVNGERRQAKFFSRYARGIGVEADGGTTTRGLAWGTGDEGVETRVANTIDELLNDIRTNASGMEPCDIWFDTFGFSRGSAAARDFANGVNDGEITYGASTMKVKFMGLFDTVSSVGNAGNTGNYEGVTLNTSIATAEVIFHITAKDEIREYFPLTLASHGRRIQMVGAHSDIGGGYWPTNGTPDQDTFTYDPEDYPGVTAFYQDRWGVTNNSPGTGDNDSVSTTVDEGYIWDTTERVISTSSHHGLQFVSLNLMFDHAKDAGVPIGDSLPDTIEGSQVSMDANLTAYYEALKSGAVRPELEKSIRRRYAHFSSNNYSTWGQSPNLPQTNGRRVVATM